MPPEPLPAFNAYDDTEHMRRQVAAGQHRDVVGGLWDRLGNLQRDFLISRGLLPGHFLVDIGAGSFRAGVKLVPYLDPGHYYAIDSQLVLLQAGYEQEIVPQGLAVRFPQANFAANAVFDVSSFGRVFDYALAQSVFTHMPLWRLEDCLTALAPSMRLGGMFFFTVFLADVEAAARPVKQMPGGVVTLPDRDPYHVTRPALQDVAARSAAWRMVEARGWSHPRNQQMVCFERVAAGD
jgi:hypothetical protein